MANIVSIIFDNCLIIPDDGYNILWRVFGTDDGYTDAGNFPGSIASFIENTNPDGTEYEGIIRADCGGGRFGEEVLWSATTSTTTTSTTTP